MTAPREFKNEDTHSDDEGADAEPRTQESTSSEAAMAAENNADSSIVDESAYSPDED